MHNIYAHMNAMARAGESKQVPLGRLWFGFSASAVAWVIQELLSAAMAYRVCGTGAYAWMSAPHGVVRLLFAAIMLCLLGTAASAGFISFRNWNHLSTEPHLIKADGLRRKAFMALVGLFVSSVFAAGIIWSGIPLIMIDRCN